MDNAFLHKYKGKKVFITGHTGFKGAWLSLWLFNLGAELAGYSLPPKTTKDLYNFLPKTCFKQSTFDTILNANNLSQKILEFKPDFIFHLAAQPLVRSSYKQPIYTYEVNVLGTGNLLMAAKELGNKCEIICITTDKVYENKEWVYPYRETDQLGGYDPYSSSKAAAEILIQSFRNSFFNIKDYSKHQKTISVARAGNVIGGGDFSLDRLIPDIIENVFNNKTILVRNPNAVRPWQHVIEPLCGYLKLGTYVSENPELATAYNFGPKLEQNCTVSELINITIDLLGKGDFIIDQEKKHPHEAQLLQLDSSLANKNLSWKSVLNFKETIAWTINWYKELPENKIKFSQGQIGLYQNKIGFL